MGLMTTMRAVLSGERTRERERDYLNQSTSILDLEYRMREVDAGKFRRSGRSF